jgi:hypothetical protein
VDDEPTDGPDLTRELTQQLASLRAARGRSGSASGYAEDLHERLVADLDAAYEELRSADEELRSHQREVDDLVRSHRNRQWQHERLMALLPSAVLTTDGRGMIRTANAAAAALLRLRMDRLVRRPVQSLIDPAQRPAVAADDRTTQRCDDRRGVLVAALADLTLIPVHTSEPGATVSSIVRICHRALGAGFEVSLAVGPPAHPDFFAATGAVAQEVHDAQIGAEQGPSRTAWEHAAVIRSTDLLRDERWPVLSRRLGDVPVTTAVSAALTVGDQVLGTMSLCNMTEDATDDTDDTIDSLVTGAAAVVHELEVKQDVQSVAAHLRSALASRAVVDQAKRILMARHGCSADEAREHLAQLSVRRNETLQVLASRLVASTQHRAAHERPPPP